MAIKLKVGEQYTTRDGRLAAVYRKVGDEYVGLVSGMHGEWRWAEDGVWDTFNGGSPWDLTKVYSHDD